MSENCVVIPLYKSNPCEWESISFAQVITILKKQDFVLVTHQNLNISYYTDKLNNAGINYRIEYFDSKYFASITGYNFLMLSKDFYSRFKKYNCILIYQLDCFVFADELDYWSKSDFDYIGSPLFADYKSYAPDRPFWYNGNGGFSIRRVSKFLKILNSKLPIKRMPQIKHKLEIYGYRGTSKFIYQTLIWLGYKNNVYRYLQFLGYDTQADQVHFDESVKRSNEDVIWCNNFRHTRINIKTPDLMEGLGFSFEQSPDYLYNLDNNTLPFGCHAWWKYNLDFWRPFIESYGHEIPNKKIVSKQPIKEMHYNTTP